MTCPRTLSGVARSPTEKSDPERRMCALTMVFLVWNSACMVSIYACKGSNAYHVWSHWSAIACKGTLINNAMYGQSAATTDWSAIHLPGVLHSPPNIASTLCILSKLCKLCTLHTLCILCSLYIVHCAHCGKNLQMREGKGWNQLSYGTSLHI